MDQWKARIDRGFHGQNHDLSQLHCHGRCLAPGQGTMIATWPENILARIDQTGSHYIVSDINMKDLRHRRVNSRVHHQKKPQVYTAITKTNKIWEVYED